MKRSIIKAAFLIFMFVPVFFCGCMEIAHQPEKETVTYGKGEKFDVLIKEDVTYSFEILDITEEDITLKVENKNPEITNYYFCINDIDIIDYLIVDDVRRERDLMNSNLPPFANEIMDGYYYSIPFFRNSIVVCVKYTAEGKGEYRINIPDGHKCLHCLNFIEDELYDNMWGVGIEFYLA